MQAKLPNDDEMFDEGFDESYYDTTMQPRPDSTVDAPDDEQPEEIGEIDAKLRDEPRVETLERIQSALAVMAVKVGQGIKSVWSRLVPSVVPSNDAQYEDETNYSQEEFEEEYEDIAEDEVQTDVKYENNEAVEPIEEPIDIVDATYEHIIESQVREAAPAFSETPPSYVDHIRTERRRRPTTIHSPIAQRVKPDRGPTPLVIVSQYNELSWDRNHGLLTITEPILEETDFDDPHPSRRKRSVSLSISSMDERIVPVLLGIMNSIKFHDETRVEGWVSELPYVCESGMNTFCWYRQNRRLKIFGKRHMDDKGLLRSSRCVELHVDQLPKSANEMFSEMLEVRSLRNPYNAMI